MTCASKLTVVTARRHPPNPGQTHLFFSPLTFYLMALKICQFSTFISGFYCVMLQTAVEHKDDAGKSRETT